MRKYLGLVAVLAGAWLLSAESAYAQRGRGGGARPGFGGGGFRPAFSGGVRPAFSGGVRPAFSGGIRPAVGGIGLRPGYGIYRPYNNGIYRPHARAYLPYYGYGAWPYYGYGWGFGGYGAYAPYYGGVSLAAYSNLDPGLYAGGAAAPAQDPQAAADRPPPDDAAHLQLIVPENAEVIVDGMKTTQTGTTREFVTPQLPTGSRYSYQITVRYTDKNGKAVEDTRDIRFQANDWFAIDFTRPAPTMPTPAPLPKKTKDE
jgi:uncharacterized protein (TIGR03000 family)